MSVELDEVDREIIHFLQEDARNNTNKTIADAVGVSPSTVGKRVKRLESSGIVKGYQPNIDYDEAGFPLRVLFFCTTSITERGSLIEDALEVPGVVGVTELMTGENNVLIEVVGRENEDITQLAYAISKLGIQISGEFLVKNEYQKPASVFD